MMNLAVIRKVVRHAIASASHLFLFPLYFLSGWVRRDPNLWVFGSWGGYRFADNAAAFFLYSASHKESSAHPVWISRRMKVVESLRARGYEAHWIWSPRGVLRCLRAKVFVFDCFSKDINFWVSRGATKINLWSGVPLKTFERDIDKGSSRYFMLFHGSRLQRCLMGFLMPWHSDRPDLLISTTEENQKILSSAFAVPENRIAVTGYPRNDLMLNSESAPDVLTRSVPPTFSSAVANGHTIFIYLPTFRDNGKPYLNLDWADLDRFLGESKAKFFYKFHPQDETRIDGRFENIIELPKQIDIYTILGRTDALISDYSSIIFDYMLLEKEIICYTPDHQEFLSESRSLNYGVEELGFRSLCKTHDDLLEAMRNTIDRCPPSSDVLRRREEVLKRFHRHCDTGSSSRVLAAIHRIDLPRASTVAERA